MKKKTFNFLRKKVYKKRETFKVLREKLNPKNNSFKAISGELNQKINSYNALREELKQKSKPTKGLHDRLDQKTVSFQALREELNKKPKSFNAHREDLYRNSKSFNAPRRESKIHKRSTLTTLQLIEKVQSKYHGETSQSGDKGYTKSSKLMSVKDILYQEPRGWDPKLSKLDIFYKEGEKGSALKSVIVFIHEGGWISGDKLYVSKRNYGAIPGFFVAHGYVFVAINFRLALNPKSPDAKVSDMALDIAKALKWLSNNAHRYCGRTSGFILWGYSSGAHLASLIATDESYLNESRLSIGDIKALIAMDVAQYDVPKAINLIKTKKVGYMDSAIRLRHLYKLFGKTRRSQMKLSPVHFLGSDVKLISFLLISSGLVNKKSQSFNYDMTDHFKKQLLNKGIDAKHHHFPDFSHIDLINRFFNGGVSEVVKDYLDDLDANSR